MKVIQMNSGELCQKIFLIVGVSILKVCDFLFFSYVCMCSVLMNTLLQFLQFEAELLNCLQQVYDINLSVEDMVSSWRRLIDPILNMAKKMKILTTLEEGNFIKKESEGGREDDLANM